MKKLLLSALLVGLAASAFAQGQIALDNNQNSQLSTVGSTSSGLFFLDGVKITGDFNAAFYGGADVNTLLLIKSFSGAQATGSGAAGAGTWTDPSAGSYIVAGAITTAAIKIEAWTGPFSSYAAAVTGGGHVATATYTGQPVAAPPGTPPELTAMPSMNLVVAPEPGTFALAGLGAAALLIFRRRK